MVLRAMFGMHDTPARTAKKMPRQRRLLAKTTHLRESSLGHVEASPAMRWTNEFELNMGTLRANYCVSTSSTGSCRKLQIRTEPEVKLMPQSGASPAKRLLAGVLQGVPCAGSVAVALMIQCLSTLRSPH